MNKSEQAKLSSVWAGYAAYYRTRLDDAVLSMYAEDLADLDYGAVVTALQNYRKNPKHKFLPMPADIRAMLEPAIDPEGLAREIAARVSGAIVKFGWCNRSAAAEFIGPVGWSVVERQGGWSHICENVGLSINPSAFQAQIREQVKSQLTHGEASISNLIQVPGSMREKLSLIISAET